MKLKVLRAVFYARVSTEEEKQLNALEKQVQENKDIIASKGWKLVDSYIDEGKSGTTTKRRGEYQRLYNDMETDKFDIIVIKSQDRLQRNTFEWYRFVDHLNKTGKKLFLYMDNKFFVPAEDALITGIKAILAEEYSRDLSKKLNNANKRRIEMALNGGALSAMGNGKSLVYKIEDGKWVKDPEEEKLGKKIFELYLQMDSIRKVRDWVNDHGYTNSVGKPFTSESISRILKNEKAKGVIVLGRFHHDFDKKKIVKRTEEELVRVPAPELAYVSEEVFEKVQKRLGEKTVYKNGKKRGRSVGRDLLSGKIYRGKCGSVLWRRQSCYKNKDGEKKAYYHWNCSSKYAKGDIICSGVSVTSYQVREIYAELAKDLKVNRKTVREWFEDWLTGLKHTLSDVTVNIAIEKDILTLENKKAKLLDLYLDGLLSKLDYSSRVADIEENIAEKKRILVPVEENEDIKEIEHVLENLDDELDVYINSTQFEDHKIDWLIEHTKRITVLENKDIAIEMEMIAGVIVAGKDFALYVHNSMPLNSQSKRFHPYGERKRACRPVLY